jgi:hypothetical protein
MATHTRDVYFNLEVPPPGANNGDYDYAEDYEDNNEFVTEFTESTRPIYNIENEWRNVHTDVKKVNDYGKNTFVAFEQERETLNYARGGDNTQLTTAVPNAVTRPYDTFRTTIRQTKNVKPIANVGNENLLRGAYSTIPIDARPTIRETTHTINYLSTPMKMYKANGADDTNIKIRKQLSDMPTERSVMMKSTVVQQPPTPEIIGDVTTVKNSLLPHNTYFDPSIIRQLDNNPFVVNSLRR